MGRKRRSHEFREKEKNVIDIENVREDRKEKRRQLAEKKKKKKKAVPTASPKKSTKKVRRRLIYMAATLGLISVVAGTGLSLMALNAQQAEAQARLEAVTIEKERLQEELVQVNTAEYIEQEARNQLRLIKPGEILYIFPEDETELPGEPTLKTYIPPQGD